MNEHTEAMVKSLVAVAWADGRMDNEEQEVLEAVLGAFRLSDADAEAMRAFANEPRGIEDVPITELSADDRRVLLQHAVILSYVDGEQCDQEKAVLKALIKRLRIPAEEATSIMEAADRRARRLMTML